MTAVMLTALAATVFAAAIGLSVWGLYVAVAALVAERRQPRGFTVRLEGAGEFHSQPGALINTLFEQLPRANCRAGECGGCRLRLLEGEVAWLREPVARIDRKAYVLACSCEARSDLVCAKP